MRKRPDVAADSTLPTTVHVVAVEVMYWKTIDSTPVVAAFFLTIVMSYE
jgi:hypothetical protein